MAGANLFPYALQGSADGGVRLRRGVVAELVVHCVGIRADDGHLHIFAERQHSVIFQQHHAFARGLEGGLQMFSAANCPGGSGFVHIRIVEKAEAELQQQYPPHGGVQRLHIQLLAVGQQGIAGGAEVHVAAGAQRHFGSFGFVGSHVMVARKAVYAH